MWCKPCEGENLCPRGNQRVKPPPSKLPADYVPRLINPSSCTSQANLKEALKGRGINLGSSISWEYEDAKGTPAMGGGRAGDETDLPTEEEAEDGADTAEQHHDRREPLVFTAAAAAV